MTHEDHDDGDEDRREAIVTNVDRLAVARSILNRERVLRPINNPRADALFAKLCLEWCLSGDEPR